MRIAVALVMVVATSCGGAATGDDDELDAGVGGGGGGFEIRCGDDAAEVCDGIDNDCDGSTDEGYDLLCEACGDACVDATLKGGAWRVGVARGLSVGNDRGIALPPLPVRNEYVYVANSFDDTVSKIRIADGVEVGRFLVGDNPSRTAVDGNGDAWVAMRGDVGGDPPKDNVVKLRGDCIPTIAPPQATRECVMLDIPEVGDLLRGVAVEPTGDVWIGAYEGQELIRIDGETGIITQRIGLQPETKPYGLAVDENGYVWIAARDSAVAIARVDPVLGAVDLVIMADDVPDSPYGIAADGEGGMWFGSNSTRVYRVDTETGALDSIYTIGGRTRGVAIDDAGILWVADSNNDELVRVDRDTGEVLGRVPVGTDPVGVAIDHDGNVWSSNYYSHDVNKVSPAGDVLYTVPVGSFPYTYSDMTGSAFRIFREMRGTFVGTYATGVDGARWASVRWMGGVPVPAELAIRVRASDSDPVTAEWQVVELDGDTGVLDVAGESIEVEVVLSSADATAEPYVQQLDFHFER